MSVLPTTSLACHPLVLRSLLRPAVSGCPVFSISEEPRGISGTGKIVKYVGEFDDSTLEAAPDVNV